jgi:hypothetical protein
MATAAAEMTEPTVSVETFSNPQHQTRYRILVDGKVIDDLGGIGWRTEEKALNYWDSSHGLPPRGAGNKAARRAAQLEEQKKRAAEYAAFEAAKEEAKKKIIVLLEQHPVWNIEELQAAVGVDDKMIIYAVAALPQVVRNINTVHKKTKELMKLRQEARKAVGAYNNTAIDIIPDSNAAPVKTGEPCSDYNLRKWGKYNPSTLLVTVGQHWLSPVVEAIAKDYNYDA